MLIESWEPNHSPVGSEDSDGFQVLCHPSESGYGHNESGKPKGGVFVGASYPPWN